MGIIERVSRLAPAIAAEGHEQSPRQIAPAYRIFPCKFADLVKI
jgi:hypothetical protein